MKNKATIARMFVLAILILLIIPVVFAGFSDIWNTITGKVTSQQASLSIPIGNNAPVVDSVAAILAQSVTESGTTAVTFSFTATDADGVANLDDTSAIAKFTSGGTTRVDDSGCSLVGDLDSDTANYTCTINLWYWDGAGTWTVIANISDINDATDGDSSTTFTLQETTAMVMGPTSLSWSNLQLSSKNQTSNNDPITINNTANKNITNNNVKVTAIDMQGETTPAEYIYAGNFTLDIDTGGSPPAECDGTAMVNGVATGVSGATIPAGNNSKGNGQEELYFCLTAIPSTISSQTYSTTGGGPWTIAVS